MESTKAEIRIMGHHLLGIFYCFSGKDYEKRTDKLIYYCKSKTRYGEQFTENLNDLFAKIAKNPEIRIRLVDELDDICEKCPELEACGGPNDMDLVVIRAFDCEVGEVYTIQELIKNGLGLLRPNPKEVTSPQRNKLPERDRKYIISILSAFIRDWDAYNIDENLLETK